MCHFKRQAPYCVTETGVTVSGQTCKWFSAYVVYFWEDKTVAGPIYPARVYIATATF